MNRLQHIWNFLLDHSWLPPLVVFFLYGALYLLILVAFPCRPLMLLVEGFIYVISYLLVIAILLMFAVIFGVFHRDKDVAECLRLLGINILVVIVGFGMQIFAGIKNPDPYAFSHPIPKGIVYNIPIEENLESNLCSMRHNAVNELDSTTWLQVSTEFIGQFAYTFYYHDLPAGDIFLRCYEVGTNAPLSADRIEQATLSPTRSEHMFCCQVSDRHFIIYEGDAQQYYVARFEVWFRSADTHQEQKLLEKLYRVDGYEH